ncbi:MAG: J domain-containing protein [Magnetococcales bacterium]|nr:J domain-containing protein [Magnetococcales bacterium]
MTDDNGPHDPPLIADLKEDAGLYDRLTWAREVLNLGESETKNSIDNQCNRLLKKWHPDLINNRNEACKTYTRQIITAKKIIDDYCDNYKYSFTFQETKKYLSPQEWHWLHFGEESV